MVSKLCNEKITIFDFVNHAVFVIDAPRPVTREGVFERFWFTDASEWLTLDFIDQLVDALNHLSVLFLPVEVILPGLV